MNSKNKSGFYLGLVIGIVLLLPVFLFSLCLSAPGIVRPYILGMPYTLGWSILISLLLILLTWLAAKVHPKRDKN